MGTFLAFIIIMFGSAFMFHLLDLKPSIYEPEWKHKEWKLRQERKRKKD